MKRAWLGLALTSLLFIGCSAPKVETHSVTGVIVSVDISAKTVTIKHDRFADGFMEAMTMPYEAVDASLIKGFKKGDKVSFTVTRQEDFYPITDIKKLP